jgi:hypothetical protein
MVFAFFFFLLGEKEDCKTKNSYCTFFNLLLKLIWMNNVNMIRKKILNGDDGRRKNKEKKEFDIRILKKSGGKIYGRKVANDRAYIANPPFLYWRSCNNIFFW